MSELLKINVNEHTERKNNLTYLSWAWAWAEVLKCDPLAKWDLHTFGEGADCQPYMRVGKTAMVVVDVTIKGVKRHCQLPVMDHRNKAIADPDAFQVNTAIMRCLAKAIAMHGLGLYIYAGEDLPEGEEAPEKPASPVPTSFRSSPTMGALEEVDDPDRVLYLTMLASTVQAKVAAGDVAAAHHLIEKEKFDDTDKTALWSLLDSKTRSAIKKHIESTKEKAEA
jgi:hypothetical protein